MLRGAPIRRGPRLDPDEGHAGARVEPREGEELQAEARLPQAPLHGDVRAGVMSRGGSDLVNTRGPGKNDNVARSKCDKCIGRSVSTVPISTTRCLCSC